MLSLLLVAQLDDKKMAETGKSKGSYVGFSQNLDALCMPYTPAMPFSTLF
jgi:hypothetical protein